MKKRRIVAVGPHRRHPGAGAVTSPLHQLAGAEDHVAPAKVEVVKGKTAKKLFVNLEKAVKKS